MLREIGWRAKELGSLLSCLLNVIAFTGDREITASAGSFEMMRRGSRWGAFFVKIRGFDHCRNAWESHRELFDKAASDRMMRA